MARLEAVAAQPVVVDPLTARPSVNPARLLHIRELDGLRGIAALMVFFHHLCFTDLNPAEWGSSVRALYSFSSFGMRGVDLFFVLSGFLITSLLMKDQASPAYYRDFYWKRALRILPLYLLCLLVIWAFVPHSGGEVLLSVFFLANFASALHVMSSGPFWTLSIEEQFYLVWPTVVRRRSVAQVSRWALGVGLGAIALRLVAAGFGHFNYYITVLRCDGLAGGALLACWFERRADIVPDALRRRESLRFAALMAAGLLCLFVPLPVQADLARRMAFADNSVETGITLIFIGGVGLIIANAGSRLLGVLRSRFLSFFGLISYAMYLVHTYVLMAYKHRFGAVRGGDVDSLVVRFFAVFSITIVVCLATRYLVELPAISLRRLVLSKPAPAAEIEAPLLAD